MPFELNGLSPKRIETPITLDELSRIITSAAKENLAIIPWGGGTMQHLGNAPRRYDLALDLSRLNRVVEYAPDDLTITVEAGATIAAIQTELAAHNQFLPLDPPVPAHATIGGTLAVNASGPLRLRYGTVRDFTLGMSVVNAEGKITKSGGKVVKNVAGYEMAKLNIGALGTLGIIAQATFKVYPKPKEEITFVAAFKNTSDACKAIKALWNLTTPPMAIELLDAKLARAVGIAKPVFPQALEAKRSGVEKTGFWVTARFGGTQTVVDAAARKAEALARDANAASFEIISDAGLWQSIANLPATLRGAHSALLRIGLPPSQLNAALEKIVERMQAIGIDSYELFAHAATAILYVAFDAEEEKVIEEIKHLRWALPHLEAHLVIEHAPRGVKEKVSVWGDPGAEHFIAQRLKEKFDPLWILNPGRFVGGL